MRRSERKREKERECGIKENNFEIGQAQIYHSPKGITYWTPGGIARGPIGGLELVLFVSFVLCSFSKSVPNYSTSL